jgi:hypothetical protein
MKNLLLLSFALFTTVCFAQTQKSHFLLHPNEITFNPFNSTTVNSNTNSYTVGNSLYDKNGNLLFYVRNDGIYDANDNFQGGLNEFRSMPPAAPPYNIIYNYVQHEVVIVPFEESCRYYVIYLNTGYEDGNPSNNIHQSLMYSIVETSPTGAVTVNSTSGNDESQLIDRFNGGRIGGIAVSPKLDDGGRFLFCVTASEVNRYRITDSGITFEEQIANFEDFELATIPDLTELDLFWKGSDEDGDFSAKLGWGLLSPYIDGNARAVTIDLDQNGDNIGHTVHVFEELRGIVGFEFAPTNSDLFFISAEDNGFNFGIYYKDGSNPYQMVSGSDECWSHIEYARDGNMYVADFNGKLKYFSPTSLPYTISTTGISIHSNSNLGAVGYITNFYTLPDQVDGVDNVFDAYYNDIESDFEIVVDLFGVSLPSTYSGYLPFFGICSPITLGNLSTNAAAYKVSLHQLDGSGNPLYAPVQSWIPLFSSDDIREIPFDAAGSKLLDLGHYGEFMLKFEAINACGASDTKIGYFEVTPPNFPNIPITINGSSPNASLPTSTPFNIYSCSTEVALLDNNFWNAHSYKVTLQSVTSSGVPTASLNTSTNWESNFSTVEDLKNLPAPNGTWLTNAANAGYYKVTLEVGHDCNGDGVRDIEEEYDGYFLLNVPPSQANMNLQVSGAGSGSPVNCMSKTPSSMCLAPENSPRYNIGSGTFASNNISAYSRKIEEVNCTDGLNPITIYQDANPIVISNPSQSIIDESLNTIVINGNQGYFQGKMGNCYKLTVTVYNACDSESDWSFFKIDRLFRKKQIDTITENKSMTIFPNPAKNNITIITNNNDVISTVQVFNTQGKEVSVQVNLISDKNERVISLDNLSQGVYLINCVTQNGTIRKKFIKN